MQDNLNFMENGRQPQFLTSGRQPKLFGKWKKTTTFLVNTGKTTSTSVKAGLGSQSLNFFRFKIINIFSLSAINLGDKIVKHFL